MSEENIKMMASIDDESREMEYIGEIVRAEEGVAKRQAASAQALKDECEAELAEAIPALETAIGALDTLKVETCGCLAAVFLLCCCGVFVVLLRFFCCVVAVLCCVVAVLCCVVAVFLLCCCGVSVVLCGVSVVLLRRFLLRFFGVFVVFMWFFVAFLWRFRCVL